jgi:hypothetical protein
MFPGFLPVFYTASSCFASIDGAIGPLRAMNACAMNACAMNACAMNAIVMR